MLDISGCNDYIMDREKVIAFCDDLVETIKMEAIGRPWVEQTAMHAPDKAGFTLVQIIQTSSITAHFIDETRSIYLDVFSCKDFSVGAVQKCVVKWFDPKKMRVNFITRNAD